MKNLLFFQHFVGCDVSKDTLDFALYESGKPVKSLQHIKVSNDLEGFQAMRKWLRGLKVDPKKAVIGMEHTGSYSVALSEWCHKKGLGFVMLHPMDVKNACSTGRNKNDKADAQYIADYLYTYREKLNTSTPEPKEIKQLRALRNERDLLVKARTSFKNQFKSAYDTIVEKRIKATIEMLTKQIHAVEKAIEKVVEANEAIAKNYHLMLSIPGIGMINAITHIIATANFTRFQTARQYAKFACISPLSNQSGETIKKGDHVSGCGHHEIKVVLTEAARSTINYDKQLRAYYERKRAEGKSHGCVMNAVKFKLICRIFAVVTRQTPYVALENYRS